MSIAEAIESRSRALSVGAHVLKVKPVTNFESVVKANALSNAVNTIASWAPDGVFGAVGGFLGCDGVEVGAVACAENLCDGVLVIEHDAGEVSVEAIV